MSLKTQAKVLRVLQEQVMEAVGGSSAHPRRCARHRRDEQGSAGGDPGRPVPRGPVFPAERRADYVPPLRERQEDIPLLADHFMAMLARETGGVRSVRGGAVDALRHYAWPGNVRELRNVVERLMIMVSGDRISSRDLSFLDQSLRRPGSRPQTRGRAVTGPLHEARDQFEREYIVRALAAQQGNISRTAELLGVERSNLYRKMRGFGIAPPRRGEEDEGG